MSQKTSSAMKTNARIVFALGRCRFPKSAGDPFPMRSRAEIFGILRRRRRADGPSFGFALVIELS
jgi:hypothetical protein